MKAARTINAKNRKPAEQERWFDAWLLEYANCTKGRKSRDAQGCVRLAREVADMAIIASRESNV